MAFDQTLKVTILGDSRPLQGELKNITAKLQTFGRDARSLFQTIGGLVGISFGASLARDAVLATDAFKVLEARIKGITAETGDFAEVSERLRAIARDTGTELQTTVSVFQSLARSRVELKATNQEMLTLTSLVQRLGVIGGASTTALQQGLLQFSQAMAAGTVRAEEFNSILENLPELANAIAKGLGVSVGELRKMVLAGKLLSADVFRTLLKQAAEIEERFAAMPITMERGWNAATQSMTAALARLNETLGITNLIGRALQGWASYLDPTTEERFNQLLAERARLLSQQPRGPGGRPNPAYTQAQQRLIEVEKELKQLQDARIEAQKREAVAAGQAEVLTIRQKLAAQDAEKAVKSLTSAYDKLVESLRVAQAESAAGLQKDVKDGTVLDINRLRDQAKTALEQGDTAAAKRFIERAKAINDYLRETSQVSKTYYDTQTQLLLDLAEQARAFMAGEKPVTLPVAPDLDGAKESGALMWETAQDAINAKGPLKLPAGVAQVGETSFADAATTGIDVPLTLDATPATQALPGVTADLQAQIKPIVQPVVLATTPAGQPVTSYADLQAEFNRQQGLATGGLVSGPGTGTSDSILARLSNKEYVVKAKSVESVGVRILDYINRFGRLPQFNLGGLVDAVSALRVPRFNAGGLVPVPAVPRMASGGPVGTPVNLYLPGGQSFGLSATPSVARELASILGAEVLKRGRR